MTKKIAKKKTKKKAKKKTAIKTPVIASPSLLEIVKRDDLARVLGLTTIRINQLVNEGMPKNERGKYNLIECVKWYINFWKQRASGDNDEKKNQQIGLIEAQRDKIVLETNKLRETLLPVEEVAHTLNAIAVIVSTQLDGLGARMANTLAGIDEPAEIQRTLFNECRTIRDNVAGQIDTLAACADVLEYSQAAAE